MMKGTEMTHEQKMRWYKTQISRYKESKYRLDREYGRYLERYFDPTVECVDGGSYEMRMMREPMPFNVYCYE